MKNIACVVLRLALLVVMSTEYVGAQSTLAGTTTVSGTTTIAQAAQATIAFVNAATGEDTSGNADASVSASALNVSGGNLLYVGVRAGSTTTPTISDTAGNTFTQIGSTLSTQSDIGVAAQFYAKNVIGNISDVVTANFSPSTSYAGIVVLQLSGPNTTNPLDISATGDVSSSASVSSASFTPSAVGEAACAFSTAAAFVSWTAGSGYTIPTGGSDTMIGGEYQLNIGTAGQTASISDNSAAAMYIMVATFKT